MAIFILVHGGAHGGWCWEHLVPELERRGHTALAPDLPGLGDDTTPAAEATLAKSGALIARMAREADQKPIVVGHSRGGPVISEAAEQAPDAIAGLVYLTALLLPPNATVLDAMAGSGGKLMEGASTTPDGTAVIFDPESAIAAFYNRAPRALAEATARRLCPDPIRLNQEAVAVTPERWGKVKRAYIECTDDRVMPLALQRKLQEAYPCEPVITLDSDHSPFLWMPETLADYLHAIAADFLRGRPH